MYKKVGLASLIMMTSVFLSRLTGLIREQVIAYIGGISGGVDAYQVAFIIPEILNHIVASGFLSVTFIPIFTHYLVQNKEEEGWRVFSLILTCFGSVLLLLILIACIFARGFVEILAPGLDDPILIERAVRMTRIIIPAQFFFFSGGMLMAVQFAKEKFFIPALSPLIYNLGIICG
jgi:putative peptidoglycan lipid II flippase